MSRFIVVVGNVGTVLETASKRDAIGTYNDYVMQSQSNRGRCAGEPVTLFQDNDIALEYAGTNEEF